MGRLDGSIAVEAALALPIFVFLGIAVLAPMQWMDTQRKIQMNVERYCEELSQYAYIADTEKVDDAEKIDDAETVEDAEKVEDAEDVENVGAVENTEEAEDILFELQYKEQIPFFFTKMGAVRMNAAAKRRRWIGFSGKLTSSHEDGTLPGEDVEMVYVTQYGARYHRNKDCMYLSSKCRAVSIQELENLRNPDGKIFHSCERCVEGKETHNTVYITGWGIRYHNDRECAVMNSYFRKVPLAEVAYMGECSVCAGR